MIGTTVKMFVIFYIFNYQSFSDSYQNCQNSYVCVFYIQVVQIVNVAI